MCITRIIKNEREKGEGNKEIKERKKKELKHLNLGLNVICFRQPRGLSGLASV